MDAPEAHAEQYLLHLGAGPVRYEPDGNQPPDFVTRDGTAVEVRRLNQHFDVAGSPVALERDAFPILSGMRRLLASFGPSTDGRSWWVSYYFRRPAPMWKDLEPAVRTALAAVDLTGAPPTERIPVQGGFKLHLLPSSSPRQQRFLLGGYTDQNAGGWLMYELQRNIQICVDEKTRKIASFRSRYRRWWLILVDHIGLGSSALEAELFRDHVRIRHDWDRVILLDPRDHTRATDVDTIPPAA